MDPSKTTHPTAAWLHPLALTALLSAAAAWAAIHPSGLRSEEVWSHLATGLWILQHHAIPRSGLFTLHADLPWIDTTWGFDALLAATFKLLSLRTIAIVAMILRVALALVTFLLAGGRRNFWSAILLSAIVQFIFPNALPLPISFSMVFLGVELLLLLNWRSSGNVYLLYGLPILFTVWCNLHIEFVLGLIVLFLYLIAETIEQYRRSQTAAWIQLRPLVLTSLFSLLATLINPYGFHLIPQFLPSAYSAAAFKYFGEMLPLSFRQPQDYVLLLLVMGAFFSIGRNHSRSVFNIALLALAACVAFRIQRETWFVALASVAIIGNWSGEKEESDTRSAFRWEDAFVAAASAAMFLVFAFVTPGPNQALAQVSQAMPVKACDYIRENHLGAPLFNSMEWGGFLTWYMPQYPVAMDSRLNLYGDDMVQEYFKTVNGGRRLENATLFADAQTILIAKNSALERALTTFPDLTELYREIYSDKRAAVLVRK